MEEVRPQEYTIFGLRVFPCHSIKNGRCTCGKTDCTSKGKHPRVNAWQQLATTDVATVEQWMVEFGAENINWGLATGLGSGLWVVDIDPKKSGFDSWESFEEERGQTFDTLKSRTGGGGRHLFFKTDGKPVPNKVNWRPGVDIRGDGGYVILPQGKHASGGRYEWIDWRLTPPSDAPDILRDLRASKPSSSPAGKRDWSGVLQGVPEGSRDDTLYAFACYLRRKLDDDRRMVETLVLEAARNCDPPFPEHEALVKVDQAFKQDHSDPAWMQQWAAKFGDGEEVPPDKRIFTETDLGNAQRFSVAYENVVKYVPEWGWLRKTDIGWERVPDEEVEHLGKSVADMIRADALKQAEVSDRARMFKFSLRAESAGSIAALVRLARSEPPILRTSEDFDRDLFTIACRNGILDLRTGQVRQFRDGDMVTKNTNVFFDPTYVLPEWEKFLDDATEGNRELQEYLQRAAGYTLTGSIQEECFFIISGPPASGKSTFVDAIYTALGSYATISQSDVFMYRRGKDTATNELARLVGTRMVAVSEIREGEFFNESLMKQITGGDMIAARLLYQNTFTFKPRFKLWIATNHDPAAQDQAMMRRIKKIDFRHVIPHALRDPQLKVKLQDPEVGGRAVLAWAVKGAQSYLTDGRRLNEPIHVTASVHDYRANNDVFGLFISESFDTVEGEVMGVIPAYNTYTMWCAMNGERPIRRPQFRQRMVDRGYEIGRSDTGSESFRGLRVKFSLGVGL